MEDEENFYDKEPYKASVHAFFSGVPPGACLLSVALIPSDRFGALLQVRGESGAGNVFCSLVDIFCSNGQKI